MPSHEELPSLNVVDLGRKLGFVSFDLDCRTESNQKAFLIDTNFSEISTFSRSVQHFFSQEKLTTPAPLLLDDSKVHAMSFTHEASNDGVTGSREDSLIGSFSDDPLTGNVTLENSATTDLPDLSIEFDKITLPKTIALDEQGQVQLIVMNQGDQLVNEPLTIRLFASTDDILDSNDQLLNDEETIVELPSGLSQTYTIDFLNPVGVAPGAYYLLAQVDPDPAVMESNETNNLASRRVSANGTDVVIDWNATLLNAVATDKTNPPVATRNMAMVHTAVYAAVYVIDQLDRSCLVDVVAPEGVSREAAVAAAAHRILGSVYPTQIPTFNLQLELSLLEVPVGQAEHNGVALGQWVADQVLRWRSADKSSDLGSYAPEPEPGKWQPTPPSFLPALLQNWGDVTPFVIPDSALFHPSGPPALSSAEYAIELNQVKELGSQDSTTRTAEQTEIARFWADGPGTFTPAGHWNLIAERVSLEQGNTLPENARLFALLNLAEADAAIASWDVKYESDFWRPITAIRQADTDGNPDTIADPNWVPLLTTPPFPEYVSGHSTFSGAADAVLTSFFGDNIRFSSTSVGLPGVVRSFDSFRAAADEAGISRIYGGIHFLSANEDGLALGRAVGNYVTTHARVI